MWLKTKFGELINTDWVSWIEIYADFLTNPYNYEIRVNFIQGDTTWVMFGRYETVQEAILERDKIEKLLNAKQ